MRPVRYNVASSLDGYIADADGEFDWIPADPSVDFQAIFSNVDTVLLGRRSYDVARQGGAFPWKPGTRVYVFSRTLKPDDCPGVTIVSDDAGRLVAGLRTEPGDGEIWLFGGGDLFATLLAADQVDTVEVTVVPIFLGDGVPLVRSGTPRARLALTSTRTYPSGMVTLSYAVERSESR